MMKLRILLSCGVSGVVLAAVAATTAWAQEAEPDANLGEIVVTAQKREQTLQDVPISITVLTSEALADAGVRDIKDLTVLTPGLTVTSTQNEGITTARIRGIGTSGDNPGLESSVGIVIDGVYRPRNGVGFGDLGEVQRIEVLRGPQGTLFGKNNSSGVISVITAAPSFDFEGTGEATISNYDGYALGASLTGPLSDRLAARLDLTRRQRDGFLDVATGAGPRTDTSDQTQDYWTVRGQLLWLPTDTLSMRTIADYSRRDEVCCGSVQTLTGPTAAFIDALSPDSGVSRPADPFARTAYSNRGNEQEIEDEGVSHQIDWTTPWFGAAELTSVTALREWESVNGYDADATSADIIYRPNNGDSATRFRQFSQELRLVGEVGQLNWLVGAFYADEDLERRDTLLYGAQASAFLSFLLTAATPAPSPNRLGCFTAAVYSPACVVGLAPATGPAFAAGDGYRDVHDQNSKSLAFFTNNTFAVTDALELTFGLRWTQEDKDLVSRFANVGNVGAVCAAALRNTSPAAAKGLICLPTSNPAFDGRVLRQTDSEEDLSGTAKASYRFSPQVLAYVSYARGFKAGGFNLDRTQIGVTPASSTAFDDEVNTTYEAGLRTQWFDDTLLVNATAFTARIDNFQINSFVGTSFIVLNAPEVDSLGIDLDVLWSMPIDGLSLQGGGSYNQTEFSEDFAIAGFPLLQGGQLALAPKYTATLGGSYERPVGPLMLRASLAARYSARTLTGSDRDPLKTQEAYTIVNGRLGIGPQDERWTAEVWAQNLFDEDYIQVAYGAPLQTGTINAFLGAPKTYGLTLRTRF